MTYFFAKRSASQPISKRPAMLEASTRDNDRYGTHASRDQQIQRSAPKSAGPRTAALGGDDWARHLWLLHKERQRKSNRNDKQSQAPKRCLPSKMLHKVM